ncbi:Uncharacterised protein [Bordetella pertussis]|nr:Uncharacterised protein [Bordetella pertussis]
MLPMTNWPSYEATDAPSVLVMRASTSRAARSARSASSAASSVVTGHG